MIDVYVLGAMFVAAVLGFTLGCIVTYTAYIKRKIQFSAHHNLRRYR